MTVAFIPVRGGSKSIPLKNIKAFCGRPLVYWNLKALDEAEGVDEIVVATDNTEIEKTVEQFGLSKVSVYRRKPENAVDTASTESVMLEYIEQAQLPADCTFMLVQATSPLTELEHFEKGLKQYHDEDCDSLLSCVRSKRFFWNEDGTPSNYDYVSRPRRQDFPGLLMENGAFYISTAGNIMKSGNRLSGKICIFEMPDYTGIEIDEEDDWLIAEALMRKHVLGKKGRGKSIKLFLTDVDGTLTDAGMYYNQLGNEMKKFNTHDGKGIELLRNAGIKTGILTSETTGIVEKRAKKLKIDYLVQGISHKGKLEAAEEICRELGIELQEAAYIGDDVNCVELLEAVGLAACPRSAQPAVKQVPGIHVMNAGGGEGAVREFIENILTLHKDQ